MNTVIIICLALICFIVLGLKGTTATNTNLRILFLYFIFEIVVLNVKTPDTEAYTQFYQSLGNVRSIYNFEYGFVLLSTISKYLLGNHISVLYFISSSICFTITYCACKNIAKTIKNIDERRFLTSCIIVYISYYGLYYNAIALRASFSISLSLLMVSLILKNGKTLKNLCVILITLIISFSFHNSSFVSVFVILSLLLPRLSRQAYIIITLFIITAYYFSISNRLLSVLPFNSIIDVLSTQEIGYGYKLIGYINSANETSAKSNFFLLNVLLSFYVLFSYQDNIPYKFLNLYLSGLLIYALFNFLPSINRISDYFTLYSFLLVSYVVSTCSFTKSKYIITCAILAAQFLAVCRIMNVVFIT